MPINPDGTPITLYARPDLCADAGHPGATYNPLMDRTWCMCGERIQEGNRFDWTTMGTIQMNRDPRPRPGQQELVA